MRAYEAFVSPLDTERRRSDSLSRIRTLISVFERVTSRMSFTTRGLFETSDNNNRFGRSGCTARGERGGSHPLEQVRLSLLMDLTAGSSEVVVGLIDGPVAVDHPDFAKQSVRTLPGNPAACTVHDGKPAERGRTAWLSR